MSRAAVFPDIENAAVTHLRTRTEVVADIATDLRGWRAGEARVVLTRTGGTPTLAYRIDAALLDVDVYAADKAAAHDLAQLARVALHDLPDADLTALGVVVANVRDFNGLRWLPDETTTAARYVFAVTVTARPHP